jgi:hypothetical protein
MRLDELRLLLALVLVLVGATVIVGVDLESDAAMMPLRVQKQPLGANSEQQFATFAGKRSSTIHGSRADSGIVPRSSSADLVHILRC